MPVLLQIVAPRQRVCSVAFIISCIHETCWCFVITTVYCLTSNLVLCHAIWGEFLEVASTITNRKEPLVELRTREVLTKVMHLPRSV